MSPRVRRLTGVSRLSSHLTRLSRSVDLFLGFDPAVPDNRVDGIDGVVHHEGEFLTLRRGEIPQDVIGRIHPPRRSPDADPQPAVLAGAERAAQRPEPVVAALPAPALEHE